MHYSVVVGWYILLYSLHNTLSYPPHCIAHKTKATCLVIIFGSRNQSFITCAYKFFHRQVITFEHFCDSSYKA